MDIPASGIYRLVELQRFDLITRKTQIAVLPQVVEGFLQIKVRYLPKFLLQTLTPYVV